jgi:hypothetical protein
MAEYGTCNPAVTSITLATVTATGTATPSAIVCPDTTPQCLSNATILCETYVANASLIEAYGQSFDLEECIILCGNVPGQLAGTFNPGEGIGACSCLSAQYTTPVLLPYDGLFAFVLNQC